MALIESVYEVQKTYVGVNVTHLVGKLNDRL